MKIFEILTVIQETSAVDAALKAAWYAFETSDPIAALNILENYGVTVNDSSELKQLFDENADQLADLAIEELTMDADTVYLNKLRKTINNLGIKFPDPYIVNALISKKRAIINELRKLADDNILMFIENVAEFKLWGLVLNLGKIIDIPKNKELILKFIISEVNKPQHLRSDHEVIINTLRQDGYEWPELDLIEDELNDEMT